MNVVCAECGHTVVEGPARGDRHPGTPCPECGAQRLEEAGAATVSREADGEPKDGTSTTLFQPGLMIYDILTDEAGETTVVSTTTSGEAAGEAPPAAPGPRAHLLVAGAAPGLDRVELRGERVTFGRRGATINVDDPTISVEHCAIENVGGEYFLRDLGSRNGTLLNGHRVGYSQVLHGDEIEIGTTTMVFHVEPGERSSSSR